MPTPAPGDPRRPRSGRLPRLVILAVLAALLLPSAAHAQAVLSGDEPNGPYPGYWSWPAMVEQIEEYERGYPHIFYKKVYGKTLEGRDMLAIRITQDAARDDRSKPEVLFMAGIHVREQQPQVSIMQFMEDLVLGYGNDERITRLIDTRSIWIIPAYNVDGKVYDFQRGNRWTRGANWRKTRRPNPNGSHGIDLNRNNPVGWGFASTNQGSQTYHGTAPLSEPESRALFNFMAGRNFRIFLDIHSYMPAWLSPPHLIREDQERYRQLANGIRERQQNRWRANVSSPESQAGANARTSNGMTNGTGLYIHGAYSWVVEMDGMGAGFWPAPMRILQQYREDFKEPLLFLVEEAASIPERQVGDFFRVTDSSFSETPTPGSQVQWTPEVEGEVAFGVLATNDGRIRVTGDYRLYPLGDRGYTLHISEDVRPGTTLPLTLYLWDRQRRQSVVPVKVTVEEPR